MPTICFHDPQISWNNILSASSQAGNLFDYNNILILMKKDAALNLSIFH